MASVTSVITSVGAGGQANISVTFDDVTLKISGVSWTILSGVLESVTISQAGKPDVTSTNLRTNGSKNIPQSSGYTFDAVSISVSWRSFI